ncbi:hypothetical protein [Cryobacterium aureum]|uniref:hypothetical protein n=1 Tax=Cryobacterium aureum TaxID=995037 RepID=UPI00196B8355|nr:hypothetical protein [Cryobacterium aureum]
MTNVTTLGTILFIAAVVILIFRRSAYPWLLAVAAAFPNSAAIVVNENALSPFYFLALPTLFWLPSIAKRLLGPGKTALTVFAVWSIFITAFGPILFAGILVLSPRNGIDRGILDPARLGLTVSNLAQGAYLLIAVGFVYFVVKTRSSIFLPAMTFTIGTILSSSNFLIVNAGGRWPSELFDSGTSAYTNEDVGGISRLRGVFAEPSLLAEFSIAAAVYFFFLFFSTKGWVRSVCLGMAVLAGLNLSASMTGTGTAAALVVIAVIAIYGAKRFLSGGQGVLLATMVLLIGTMASLLWAERAIDAISTVVNEKIGSYSQITRSSADLFSLGVLKDTYLLGAGLGSNRPSSFVAMLLSCVGIVGFLAFFWFLTRLIGRAGRTTTGRAISWALFAVVVAKTLAAPDLSSPILWILIAGCANESWGVSRGAPDRLDVSRRTEVRNRKVRRTLKLPVS